VLSVIQTKYPHVIE